MSNREQRQAQMNAIGAALFLEEEEDAFGEEFGQIQPRVCVTAYDAAMEPVSTRCYWDRGHTWRIQERDPYREKQNPSTHPQSPHQLALRGFGRMGVPAGMQLPPSWGVPDASMVKPGETPEGWDPNLFPQFGEDEDDYQDSIDELEEAFGEYVVPHLCETQWGESDARCIQYLGDPTFGQPESEDFPYDFG